MSDKIFEHIFNIEHLENINDRLVSQKHNFSKEDNIILIKTSIQNNDLLKKQNAYGILYNLFYKLLNTLEKYDMYIRQFCQSNYISKGSVSRIEKNFMEDEDMVEKFIENTIKMIMTKKHDICHVLILIVPDESNVPNYNSFFKMMTEIIEPLHSTLQEQISFTFDAADIWGTTFTYTFHMDQHEYITGIYNRLYNKHVEVERLKTYKPNFKYTGPAILSENSPKRLDEFEYGDILYCNMENELVSGSPKDTSLTPVAICLKNQNDKENECRFMGLNYLSSYTPNTGSENPNNMSFGLDSYDTKDKSMQELYDILNNADNFIEQNWKSGPLVTYMDVIVSSNPNSKSGGYIKTPKYGIIAPVINSAYRYRTYGTNHGQWEIPSKKDYVDCFMNYNGHTSLINKARKSIGMLPLTSMYGASTSVMYDNIVLFPIMGQTRKSTTKLVERNTPVVCIPILRVIDEHQ